MSMYVYTGGAGVITGLAVATTTSITYPLFTTPNVTNALHIITYQIARGPGAMYVGLYSGKMYAGPNVLVSIAVPSGISASGTHEAAYQWVGIIIDTT